MAQAVRPDPVPSLANLTAEEINRHGAVWLKMKNAINENPQIPNANREAVLKASAAAINDFALNRGFYSAEIAQAVEIEVNALIGAQPVAAPPAEIDVIIKPIIQQPESIGSVIKKSFVQAIFATLGWQIASQFHPAIGLAVGVSGLVANTQSYQRSFEKVYKA